MLWRRLRDYLVAPVTEEFVFRGCMAPLLLLAAFGVYSDWRMPSRAPTGFAEAMRRFEASPPGTTMSFEFHPLFEQMPMRLTKR